MITEHFNVLCVWLCWNRNARQPKLTTICVESQLVSGSGSPDDILTHLLASTEWQETGRIPNEVQWRQV